MEGPLYKMRLFVTIIIILGFVAGFITGSLSDFDAKLTLSQLLGPSSKTAPLEFLENINSSRQLRKITLSAADTASEIVIKSAAVTKKRKRSDTKSAEINWSATTDAAWLSVYPTNGNTPLDFEIEAERSLMPEGRSQAKVFFTTEDGSQKSLPVRVDCKNGVTGIPNCGTSNLDPIPPPDPISSSSISAANIDGKLKPRWSTYGKPGDIVEYTLVLHNKSHRNDPPTTISITSEFDPAIIPTPPIESVTIGAQKRERINIPIQIPLDAIPGQEAELVVYLHYGEKTVRARGHNAWLEIK